MTAADSSGVLYSVDELVPQWIAEYVTENGICASGYAVNELPRVVVSKNFTGGTNYRRHYIIKCS